MSFPQSLIPKWISINLLVLMTAGLCFWTGIASLLPIIPLFIRDFGGTQQQVGVVMGAFAIGLILSRPHLGLRADTHSRKQVLLIGLAVGGIAPLTYLIAPNIISLFGLRAFHGISIAAFTTAYAAYVVDQVPPERRTEILGYTSLVTPIGLGVGPVLGGLLHSYLGYGAVFLVASGLNWIGFVSLLSLKESFHQCSPRPIPTQTVFAKGWLNTLGTSQTLLWQPRLKIMALVMLSAGGVFGTLSTFMPLYVDQLGISFNPGFYYLFAAIASFTMRLVTGSLAEKLGKGRFVTLSLVCYGFSMVLLWMGQEPWMFVLSGLVEGCAGGLLIPVISSIVADRSQPNERGQVFGVCLGGFDVGIALAGPVFGTLVQYIGLQQVFLGASIIAISAMVIFICYGNHSLKRSVGFALGQEADYYSLPIVKEAS